jgi:hypothetical protein
VITVVQYSAQLDPQGNPAKDANGRFTKTNNILGYAVMEKRAGMGRRVFGGEAQRRMGIPSLPCR